MKYLIPPLILMILFSLAVVYVSSLMEAKKILEQDSPKEYVVQDVCSEFNCNKGK